MNTLNLNKNELTVLKALINEVKGCTGNEFGYMEDVNRGKFSNHEFAGYISALSNKKVFDYLGGEIAGQFAIVDEIFNEYDKTSIAEEMLKHLAEIQKVAIETGMEGTLQIRFSNCSIVEFDKALSSITEFKMHKHFAQVTDLLTVAIILD